MGWTYRTEDDMEIYGRDLTDPIVEALLIPAIMRINRAVDTEAKARKVVDVLRAILRLPDPLEANRRMLEALPSPEEQQEIVNAAAAHSGRR